MTLARGLQVKLNDYVYQLRGPQPGHDRVDVILVHGLQMGDYHSAYLKTWQSKGADGKVICSLPECIGHDFPGARVLSVSYNASAADWKEEDVLSGSHGWAHAAAAVCQHLSMVEPPLGDAPLFFGPQPWRPHDQAAVR